MPRKNHWTPKNNSKYHKKAINNKTVTKKINKHEFCNKLIFTVKKPSKKIEKLCKQLRRIFMPLSLPNIKETSIKQKDCEKFADEFSISHLIFVYEKNSKIYVDITDRIQNETHNFELVKYDETFKNFPNVMYKEHPFISMSGNNNQTELFFRKMYKEYKGNFKRILHFEFEDDFIFIRHYCYRINDNEKNYKVKMTEIGPRIDLKKI
ncbi:hypothetical protein NUSPORA_02149 [Nucleospora cyclopteri]